MRTLIALALLLPATGLAQEAGSWHIMPGCSFVKFFPGPAYGGGYTEGGGTYKYEGSGLNFQARCFNDSLRGLALTFGAGVTWFYGPDGNSFAEPLQARGIGQIVGGGDFSVFPVALGVQFVFPYDRRDALMLFAGAEGNLNLVSGYVPPGQQAKLGYSLVGGFAVKIFEFGVRYTEFSDLRNLGAYFGFRVKSFTL